MGSPGPRRVITEGTKSASGEQPVGIVGGEPEAAGERFHQPGAARRAVTAFQAADNAGVDLGAAAERTLAEGGLLAQLP